MTNNEEINELLKCSICEYFKNGVCTTKEYCEYERHRAIVVMQEFAQWKDEQFKEALNNILIECDACFDEQTTNTLESIIKHQIEI